MDNSPPLLGPDEGTHPPPHQRYPQSLSGAHRTPRHASPETVVPPPGPSRSLVAAALLSTSALGLVPSYRSPVQVRSPSRSPWGAGVPRTQAAPQSQQAAATLLPKPAPCPDVCHCEGPPSHRGSKKALPLPPCPYPLSGCQPGGWLRTLGEATATPAALRGPLPSIWGHRCEGRATGLRGACCCGTVWQWPMRRTMLCTEGRVRPRRPSPFPLPPPHTSAQRPHPHPLARLSAGHRKLGGPLPGAMD